LTCPCGSFCVAETLRLKFVALTGVMVRDDSDHPSTLTDVWPVVAVKEWPQPSPSVAPTSMALIVILPRLMLSPARFLSLAPRFKPISQTSPTVASTDACVGATDLPSIPTLRSSDLLTCPCGSFCVAETLRLKFVALTGVMVRDDSNHPSTLTDVWPVVAVK